MPYDLFSWKKRKTMVKIRMPAITFIKTQPDQIAAHSVRADPLPSHPNGLFFLVLLHVVPTFAGHWLLIFSPFRRPGPTLTPSSHMTPFLSDPRQQPVSKSGTGILLYQQRDVVFVYWAKCILSIWGYSIVIWSGKLFYCFLNISGGEVACPIRKTLALNRRKTASDILPLCWSNIINLC